VETNGMLPLLAILALAVVVVIVLLRLMRARGVAATRRAAAAQAEAPAAPLTKEEQEYLDSSHILPGGRDALDTRARTWRDNQGK
jgi:hypothetical protein